MKFHVKFSYPKEHNNHKIGIGEGMMDSPMPDMEEAKTYAKFHNEFSNRKMAANIISNMATAMYKNPVEFHSMGHKKTTTQQAGKDKDGYSMGHKMKIKAQQNPKHNEKKEHPIENKELHSIREVAKVKTQHPESHKADNDKKKIKFSIGDYEKKQIKKNKLKQRKEKRKMKRKVKKNN